MVCNLGFFMDKYLKNKDHINRITSSTYNILRKVHQSRSLLDKNTTKIIIQASPIETGLLQFITVRLTRVSN